MSFECEVIRNLDSAISLIYLQEFDFLFLILFVYVSFSMLIVKVDQSCQSGRAFRVGFGPGLGLKLTKISGLIRAWEVHFALRAQKYNQNN